LPGVKFGLAHRIRARMQAFLGAEEVARGSVSAHDC